VGHGDADCAGCMYTSRSTSGYAFMLNGGAVSWSSKRQAAVAMSMAAAEYIAAAAAVKGAFWFRKLGYDLQQAWGSGSGAVQLLTTVEQHWFSCTNPAAVVWQG